MSTAKRRINSTGRKKLRNEHIDLRLLSAGPGERPKAKLDLKLETLGLPSSASIVVEAYHRSSAMRFDCGTVGAKKIPDVISLDEIDHSSKALFRIKIVSKEDTVGKILASAERLRPQSDANDSGRRSLFPVQYDDLGEEVWQVSIEDDAIPVLILNYRVPGIQHRIHDNPLLAGSILPAALRIVLQYLTANPAEDDDEEGSWKTDWFKYCSDVLGLTDDPDDLDDEGKTKWVDEGVKLFSKKFQFVERARLSFLEHTHVN